MSFPEAQQHEEVKVPMFVAQGVDAVPRQQVGQARGKADAQDCRGATPPGERVEPLDLLKVGVRGRDIHVVDATLEHFPREARVARLRAHQDHPRAF